MIDPALTPSPLASSLDNEEIGHATSSPVAHGVTSPAVTLTPTQVIARLDAILERNLYAVSWR